MHLCIEAGCPDLLGGEKGRSGAQLKRVFVRVRARVRQYANVSSGACVTLCIN